MAVVDGQDGVEYIVFCNGVSPVCRRMVASGRQRMGIGFEQGAQAMEEIRPIITDAEKLEALQSCLEKTHERRPCVIMVFHILSIAFENGGFCERIIRMLPAKFMPISMPENEHQVAFEQLKTRYQ